MGDVGVVQQRYVSCDITRDPHVSDLLQGSLVLPHSYGYKLRHVTVVI